MFGWMKSLVSWSPEDARRRIWSGDAPSGMRVNGNLELAHSPLLTSLPPGLSAQRIDVSGCQNLKSLPPGLRCQELLIARTAVEELPSDLHVSRRIDARHCGRLRRLPPLEVDELYLRGCTALEKLPERLVVRTLDISDCTRLTRVPPGAAASLHYLHASGCGGLTTLPAELTELLDLDITGCSGLTSLPGGMRVHSWIELAGTSLSELPWRLRSARLFWRGVPIPHRVVFEPESITAREIINERNQELRRVMLERMGLPRFILEARAEVLDHDHDAGGQRQLLRIRIHDGDDVVCVAVQCPSTGHRYVLRVPPHMRSCREAIAWTAGFQDPADYQPQVET